MHSKLRADFKKLFVTLFIIYLTALLVIVSGVFFFDLFNKNELAKAYASTARNSLVVRDLRQAMSNLEEASLNHFAAIGFFDENGEEVFVLPSRDRSELLVQESLWNRVLEIEVDTNKALPLHKEVLRFSIRPFQYVPYAFGVWLLFLLASIPVIKRSKERILARHAEELSRENAEAIGKLARQVAHDIQSPLVALTAITQLASGLEEEARVNLRLVAQRIRDIAHSLLKQGQVSQSSSLPVPPNATVSAKTIDSSSANESLSSESVSEFLGQVLSQKRFQFTNQPNLKLILKDQLPFGIFSQFQPVEFSRVLSNLINNAAEALKFVGTVTVHSNLINGSIVIEVIDSGTGMTPQVLSKLGQEGFTLGKENTESGSGLGVAHAFSVIQRWGGSLSYTSEPGMGTTAKLNLLQSEAPAWFACEINLSNAGTVIILDDDPTIHGVWKEKLKPFRDRFQLLHFQASDEIIEWFRGNLGDVENPVYLCDYELIGSKLTGLEVIEALGIEKSSVLITSRSDEPLIRDKCLKLGVKLLPKGLASLVPVVG